MVEQFKSGVSMEMLAERLRVGIWQVEAIIRAALQLNYWLMRMT